MKKIIFIFLIICTSFSYAENINEKNTNIIIDSKKVELKLPIISYNDYTLVPIKNIMPYFNIGKESLSSSKNSISLKKYSSTLDLYVNSTNGYINGNKITLPVAPVIYKNNLYAPIRVISDFYDCYIYYDNLSNTIFIRNINEFQQIENFFKKVQDKLKNINSLQIDIINELSNGTSSYAFGNSIYINKKSNTIFEKNVLDSNWKESKQKINSINYDFNSNFFAGLSFDRTKSSETQLVFTGFYPSNNILCETLFYVDTTSILINKQVCKFVADDVVVKQTSLYTYE